MRELVIDVDQQNRIDGRVRQLRIADRAQDRLDVRELALLHARADQGQHFRLDIDGENLAGRPDSLGEAKRVVAAAGADVGDDFAGFRLEDLQESSRLLFFSRSGRSSQPAASWPMTWAISRPM